MSEIRKNNFLKELRQNREYMFFIHSSLLNSKFTWLIVISCVLFTAAEHRTGGAFPGIMMAILIYLLNYIALLYTAEPSFAMRGSILRKVVYAEYADYTVENGQTVRKVISERTDYNIGDEVYLFRFRPCFFLSQYRTGMAPVYGCDKEPAGRSLA